MRFFYLSILCIFSYSSLFAQIELAPLSSNPILQIQQAKNGKTVPSQTIQTKMTNTDCSEVVATLFGEGTDVFVTSGESLIICIDDFLFNNLDTVICKNCDNFQFGTLNQDLDNFCFTYTADTGLILEVGDEIILEVCDDYGCEDLVFPIVVRRANASITQPMVNLSIESSNTICLNNVSLPGQEKHFSFLDCHDEALGQIFLVDSCFIYKTNRFQEMDEVCIEVCDEYCVCDTYTFPISITGPTLGLPFFDDFSYDGPHPDRALWLDDKVFVNSSLPYQPPSVGVATFDGLDEGGTPYGGGFGAADVLTSGYIDLSSFNSSNNVYLSYYIQPKGISNFFPGLNDSLTLEFVNDTGVWEKIMTFDGLPNSTSPLEVIPFDNFQVHKLTNPSFFHDRFQFRFTGYNKRNGLQSLWHLDYVRLNNDDIPTGRFPDITFTEVPSSLLKEYRHMPWHQFLANPANEIANTIDIALYNHNEFPDEADPSSLTLVEKKSNTNIINGIELLLATPNQKDVASQIHTAYTNPIDFSAVSTLTTTEKDLVFDMRYALKGGQSQSQSVNTFPALGRNDTVHVETHFSNYFAYDDGSPEAIITGNQNQLQIASQFHANVADSMVAVQFNFPYTNNSLSADFIIKVWLGEAENSDAPIYTSPPLAPIIANQFFDTINAFTTYKLLSETLEEVKIPIPAGDFFVGIQQVSAGVTGIGFDQNSQDTTHHYFRAPGSTQIWRKVFFPGALMIRPVVGGESPSTTATEELDKTATALTVKIFPNPTQGLLYLPVNQENTNDLEMMIVNSTGQVMLQQKWQAQLDLTNWSDGLYFLQIRDAHTGAEIKEKFLILR